MQPQAVSSAEKLAIDGGTPVRSILLPYGHQSVSEDDIQKVSEVLRSDWITTGQKVDEFESAFASFTGAKEAVAVNSGTAALHAAFNATGIGPGDRVIVPTMTFAATVNMAVLCGATPVFIDSDPNTLLIDSNKIESAITPKTKAIVAVDYAGQSCDYDQLRSIADRHNLILIADACHALGGSYKNQSIGTLADLNCFSFHPVKPLTTGEGGMVTTNDSELARKMRQFRNHSLTSDHRERHEKGSWFYGMDELGMNYRLTDIQCALGLNQLNKVPEWTARRQAIANKYNSAFELIEEVRPLFVRSDVSHAYHLYVIQLGLEKLAVDRNQIFKALRAENIGVNVHYIPAHLHSYYRNKFGTAKGLYPVAESAYEKILTLPLYPSMSDEDSTDVIKAVKKVVINYRRVQ